MHSAVAQVAQSLSPSTIKATAASLAAGGLVFLGCEAVTAGAGSVGCVTASSAASGAIYNAMTCPPGASVWRCAATGAVSGAASGLTLGLTAGAGPVLAGALASVSGNVTSQLLATGHVNPGQLAGAALGGAGFGAAGDILRAPDTTSTLTDDTPAPADATNLYDAAGPAEPALEPSLATQESPASLAGLITEDAGGNFTGEDLYAFGNKAAPRAPRPVQDFQVSSPEDTVGPYSPSSPTDLSRGASTFIDPKVAGLSGQYHVLPAGTELPDGLAIHADGQDVGGELPWGHRTIYPTVPMSVSEFADLFLSLPWQWAGKI